MARVSRARLAVVPLTAPHATVSRVCAHSSRVVLSVKASTVGAFGQWLLLLAVGCLLLQSTLLPVIPGAPQAPDHRHLTLGGVVPPHTHSWDTGSGQSQGPSCQPSAQDIADAARPVVVCTGSDSAGVGSAVPHVMLQSRFSMAVACGCESASDCGLCGNWSGRVVAPLTPPPRSAS